MLRSPMLVNVTCSTQACGIPFGVLFPRLQRATANADTSTRMKMQGMVRERV